MGSDIDKLIDMLPEDEKVLILSKILGYERVPSDIESFINDDYYLGRSMRDTLYPFWMDELKKIFPNPVITRHPYISLGGAIGTGKSTMSKVMTLYMLHRLDCLSNPWKTLGISKTKSLAIAFQHTTAAIAYKEFGRSIETMMEQSPYFNNMHHNHDVRFIYSGTRDQNILGSDLIASTLSEINFINPDVAKDKMDTTFGRFTSRFNKMRHYLGFIILDTSSKGDASVVENFLRDNAFGDDVISIKASQWEAKGSKFGGYWQRGSFKVYAGDALHYPFIITDEEKEISDSMDRDRILVCPMEVYPHFKQDIIKSLNDLAGYSVHSTGKYLPDPRNFLDCCKLPKLNPDEITVDFNDLEDKIMYKVRPAIDRIPKDAVIWISVDLGVVSDRTGLAICYFDKWVYYGENKTPQPYFIVPLVVGISRVAGQETSILHIYDFIKELSKEFEIGMVTADSFQSRQLFQDLSREGIPTKYVSVDKTDTAYNIVKNLYNRFLVEYPDNEIFKREVVNLNHINGKVDHPSTCFPIETELLTVNKRTGEIGYTSIAELMIVKDMYQVFTYNLSSKEVEFSDIERIFWSSSTWSLIRIEMNSGYVFKCTADHKILTESGYINAVDVVKGMKIINVLSESDTVKSSELIIDNEIDSIRVYDLTTVSSNHNFALKDGSVVHNCSKDISDAVTATLTTCYENLDLAQELSGSYRSRMQMKLLDGLNEDTGPKSQFQGMLNNTFNY